MTSPATRLRVVVGPKGMSSETNERRPERHPKFIRPPFYESYNNNDNNTKCFAGAFGVATLYRNTNKNIFVVIKQINMLDMTAQERQLALNEAKVLSLLSHPNIIRYRKSNGRVFIDRRIRILCFRSISKSYYGSFEMDGVLMIEMEYADGGTLSEYLIGRKANLLPERQILEMFLQMSEAILCIHQRNILHR